MTQELTPQEIWSLVLQDLEALVTKQTINTWFAASRAVAVLEGAMTVELKNRFSAQYVEQNYQEALDAAAGRVLQRPFRIGLTFRADSEQIELWQPDGGGNGTGRRSSEAATEAAAPEPSGRPASTNRGFGTARKDSRLKGSLNPRYTFENFVAGRNSQFAHAAALGVAESPAARYNPLFIHGGVGLGKTHLMQAIGHALLNNPAYREVRVCYTSAEEFLNELIAAITSGSTTRFRNHYRQMDVLLIDDIEFLARKESTQEEFFHTFNALYESQKQIVLTSDRPPREIHHLEERLRSRFQWGLVADIQPPEFETRIAILRKKSALCNLLIPEKVLAYIAENVTGNVRVLEGSLLYLKHHCDTSRERIDLQLAERVLRNVFEQEASHIATSDILRVVCDCYGVPEKMILSARRKQSFVEPRQAAMYICQKLTKLSLTEIAEQFKRKDHTTVLHACRKIAARCEEDIKFREQVEHMMDRLKNQKVEL